ncbi:MAG: GAF domain-containing protein [Chloroflexi bacterium]|nr:GAF domain-containing protein [Chloroflexota bacterium]
MRKDSKHPPRERANDGRAHTALGPPQRIGKEARPIRHRGALLPNEVRTTFKGSTWWRSRISNLIAAVAAPSDPQEVFQALAERLIGLVPYDQFSAVILSADQAMLEVMASSEEAGPFAPGNRFALEECVSSLALEKRQSILRRDLQLEARFPVDQLLLAAGLRSHIVAPLVVGDRQLGALYVAHRQPRRYSQPHASLLSEVAVHVALALQQAWQLQAAQKHGERMHALARGLFAIGLTPLSQAMADVLEVAVNTTGITQIAFFRHDEASGTFALEEMTTPIPGLLEQPQQSMVYRLGEEQGLVGLVGATGKSLYVPDCWNEPRWVVTRSAIRSAYIVPVVFGKRAYGVMQLVSTRVDGVSSEERSLADIVAAYAGAVLENARLYQEMRSQLEHSRRRIAALEEAVEWLNLAEDPEPALQHFVDTAQELTDARDGALALWDARGRITRLITPGSSQKEKQGINALPGGWEVLRFIRDEARSLRTADLAQLGLTLGSSPDHPGAKSILGVPIVLRGKATGAFALAAKQKANDFSVDDERLLRFLATLARGYLENIDLYREVERERSTLAAIQSSMAEGLAVFDPNGRVVYCNRAVAALSGLTDENTPGKPIEAVFGLQMETLESSETLEALKSLVPIAAQKPAPVEITLPGPQRRELSVTAFPIPSSPEEQMTGILVRDVTEERKLEHRRDAFVSVASHELRTPMTTIMGFAQLLLDRDPPETIRRQWLERILKNSQRLTAIVDDLLNVSRIQSGKLVLNVESLPLREIVEEAVTTARASTDRHRFVLQIPPGLPRVEADRDKLIQVLINLLGNAVKYSPGGGLITFSARHNPERQRVVVSVADQGIGIAPQDQARLFTTFQRIRRPETAQVSGTGLGLYIVKSLVELMRGEVWLESELNKGSTFFFSLPTQPAEPPVATGPS